MKTRTEKNTGPKPETTKIPAKTSTQRRGRWTPQPCGIPREEMRRIVLEMIG